MPFLQTPSHSEDFLVVAIGASAGGLEACRKFLDELHDGLGMAFILVQHLDPTHESLLVELLASHTSLQVSEAKQGTLIKTGHLYIIPPGTYLSVSKGKLCVSVLEVKHSARLPFDFLLKSIAEDLGQRAVCIVLSGTGNDGSLGLKAIKENGGYSIAQEPSEADYDGMSRSAIASGFVDIILPTSKMPKALADHRLGMMNKKTDEKPHQDESTSVKTENSMPAIINLLHIKTNQDFTLYKAGTLLRRTKRRMALSNIMGDNFSAYLELLQTNPVELNLLAKDLLINVTNFFRDPKIFDFLATQIIPDLVRDQPLDKPLRIWIAGCSTGEEAYSLAILFREAISASKRNLKLQIFASDVDADAITVAREGSYSTAIEADISPDRLERFFTKENETYLISRELRADIVFAVLDVLADPPFSRLDMISCRNLLIYLQAEAQFKVLTAFHFALRENGILLLGSSETVGNFEPHFKFLSKPERVYRHFGASKKGKPSFSLPSSSGNLRPLAMQAIEPPVSRPVALSEICSRALMEDYAPAAVLINRKNECLYFSGATDTYLKIPHGQANHDILIMAREGVQVKLRLAIHQAIEQNKRVILSGGRFLDKNGKHAFSICVKPIIEDDKALLLVCFINDTLAESTKTQKKTPEDLPRIAELEHELMANRSELSEAIRNLEVMREEHKAINEESLSVNEEFQSTNEELLTSKEELQSLNEELTVINSQLQETLERQRTTSNDLQNILYSTDIATLFLDLELNIRFFTPATKKLFSIIPIDVGRPLSDFRSLANDPELVNDAHEVINTLASKECEVEANNGSWFRRKIQPYRTQEHGVEGVVITFNDITERRKVANDLECAQRDAQTANIAKTRFLSAASHDLRQPLQTLALIQGLLAKKVDVKKTKMLVDRFDDTVVAMSEMLNTLLDINKIEAGTVCAEIGSFSLREMMIRLRGEFALQASSQNLDLRLVASDLIIDTDPALLEQIIRNFLSNALKYTVKGKILFGCRRQGEYVSIQIWDQGIGIAAKDLKTIFDEYYQIDNPARQRGHGLGLGLSIVKQLAQLLGHPIEVHSRLHKGSVFTIKCKISSHDKDVKTPEITTSKKHTPSALTGLILIIEDNPEISGLLDILLTDEGHKTLIAPNGAAALKLLTEKKVVPNLVLTDYNLPYGLNGVDTAIKLRAQLHRFIPTIVLTGDISSSTLRTIATENCVHLNKPVKPQELNITIQRLLLQNQTSEHPTNEPMDAKIEQLKLESHAEEPTIYIVDDDSSIRASLRAVFEEEGRVVADFESCETFLESYRQGKAACLLIDAYLPGMSGVDLLQHLKEKGDPLPAIMITGSNDVAVAVQAMKAGATDFIQKPIGTIELLASVERAFEKNSDSTKRMAWQKTAQKQVAKLTMRQREIMALILAGHPNKNIAMDLHISQRTVENHRASIMKKTGAKSLPELARLALTAQPVEINNSSSNEGIKDDQKAYD